MADFDERTAEAPLTSLRVLALLCEAQRPLTPDDIGRELDLAADDAHDLLRALELEGYTAGDPRTGMVSVGPRFVRMARFARSPRGLEPEIRAIMRELVAATGETVTYNTFSRGMQGSVCVFVEMSPSPLQYAVEVGELKPLHAASSGRAILAHLPEAEVEDYIVRTGLPAFTARTITDPVVLRAELAKIRRDGYALSTGHRIDGSVAIAGSVFDSDNRIHASLVLSTPTYRFDPARQDATVAVVRHAAQNLSNLGIDGAGV